MPILIAALGFLSGILVNALSDSLPRSRRVERPACLECGAPRRPVAWSGAIAYGSGNRTCDYCGTAQSLRAPIVEIISVAWPLLLYWLYPQPEVFWPTFIISIYFLLIIVIDYEHRLILFVTTIPAAVLLIILGSIDPSRGLVKTLAGGLVGFSVVFGLYLFGGVFARLMGRLRGQPLEEVAFGFGDVALAGVIGLAVGYPGIVAALVLGILAGGLFSLGYLIYMGLRRRYEAFVPIPYSPFLIFGGLTVFVGARADLFVSLAA